MIRGCHGVDDRGDKVASAVILLANAIGVRKIGRERVRLASRPVRPVRFRQRQFALTAIGIIAVAVVIIGSIGPISRAWIEDRKDRRRFDLQNRKLQDRLNAKLSRKRSEGSKSDV